MTNINETKINNCNDKRKDIEIKDKKDTRDSTASERSTCVRNNKRIKTKSGNSVVYNDK